MPAAAAVIEAEPGSGAETGRGIRGHLHLVCAPDSRGVPILREQSFRAPIHLSKPHLDEGALVVNVVNPTAGLLEGDRIEQNVRVQSGARLLLTCPSASRAHRVRNGWSAVSQTFRVEAGGALEVLPEMFIPQAGACYRQSTRVEVECGGELLFFESLAPGRVASGEVFEYGSLDWRTDLIFGGRPIVRERYCLEPGSDSIQALRRVFPTAYYGSVLAVGRGWEVEAEIWQEILGLQSSSLWVGVSPLGMDGAWSLKWIAADALTLRATTSKVRAALYRRMRRQAPDLRRVCAR